MSDPSMPSSFAFFWKSRIRKLLLVIPLLMCSSGCELDVDQLIARHIHAMGGLKKQKSIQTMRVTQRVETGNPANDFEFVIMRKRGNKYRMEDPPLSAPSIQAVGMNKSDEQIPHSGTIDGCDGQRMWHKVVNSPAEPWPGSCVDIADMDGLLVDYKKKEISVQLAGVQTIEGRDLYKLELTRKNGRVLYFYLDAKTYLLARIVTETNGMHQEDIYSDYRTINGIMVPFCDEMRWWKLENGGPGKDSQPAHQKQIIEKIEFNVPLDDSLFAMPSGQ